MEYDDFVLHIGDRRTGGSSQDHGYAVRVLQSPAGEGRGRFEPPIKPSEISALTAGYAASRVRKGGPPRPPLDSLVAHRDVRRRGETMRAPTAEDVGGRLFDALFRDQVAGLYDRSQGLLQATGRGLRLKIRLDQDALAESELELLPWELLFHRGTGKFLALDRHSSIVRYLDVPQPSKRIPLPDVLRVLAVTAEPTDGSLDVLDLDRELEKLEAAAAANANWHFETLRRASVSDVRARLRATELWRGATVGEAVSTFGKKHAELAVQLVAAHLRPGSESLHHVGTDELWLAYNDARSHVVLGDPAVALPAPCGGKGGPS